jgi:hypothetical protein
VAIEKEGVSKAKTKIVVDDNFGSGLEEGVSNAKTKIVVLDAAS